MVSLEKELFYYKKTLLIFVLLLLLNPIVFYLLSKNILLSLLIPTLSVFVVLATDNCIKQRWVLVYLVNLIAIFSIFLHAEVIFNTCFKEYNIIDNYTFRNGFYFNNHNLHERFLDTEYASWYITNKQGYRIPSNGEPDIEIKKADWLFLGDSFTQGAQVDFEDLFTSLLYRKYPDKVIVNAGISGFSLVDAYNYYRKEGYKLRPKKVFLQIGSFNDFMNVIGKRSDIVDHLMHRSNFLRYLLFGLKYQNTEQLPLGRWTEPFYPDEKSNIDYNIFYIKQSKYKKSDIEAFKKYLNLLKKEIEKNEGELIVFLIPTKEQVYPRYYEEVINNFKIDPKFIDLNHPNRLMKELTDSLMIDFIDYYDLFAKYIPSLFFGKDEHLNKNGHQVLAEGLDAYLRNKFIKPNSRILSKNYVGDRYPRQLQNGQSIVYQSFADNNLEIFLADNDFKNIKRVTNSHLFESHPDIALNNIDLVATEGRQESYMTDVVLINLKDQQRKHITFQKNIFGAIPTFNITGKKITYAEWKTTRKGSLSLPRIVVYDLHNDEKQYITNGKHEVWRPIFSPDSKTIVYISKKKKNENHDIYKYDSVLMTSTNLTNSAYDEWDPMYSHDGRYLVYSAHKNDNWDLFVYDFHSNTTYQLTNSIGDEWDPSFTIDGKDILFAGSYGPFSGIYTLNNWKEKIINNVI